MTPEIESLDTRPMVIRIPHQLDVPLTPRVGRLIDSQPLQRLKAVSQLGLVSLVYPGARHSRFEHLLGAYRNVLLFVRQLSRFEQFRQLVDQSAIETVVAAALLHDLGHWPYCHPIEDLGLPQIPKHEQLAAELILESELAELFRIDWEIDLQMLFRLISNEPQTPQEKLLCSLLSGPIDIDKMDYLYRDSLHCGVPYGMNFDAPRLIHSLCLNQQNDRLAITPKGKTAAEMMVFARYVMFSEVYWHHAVRSATAMVQRLFYRWMEAVGMADDRLDLQAASATGQGDFPLGLSAVLASIDDSRFVKMMEHTAGEQSILFSSLFGRKRNLYKRWREFTAFRDQPVYRQLAHRPFSVLVELSTKMAETISRKLGRPVVADDILIDAPPAGLEVQFKVEVNDGTAFYSLDAISPVVRALAEQQFDSYVKRVRVFVPADLLPRLADFKFENLLSSCLD